MRGRPYVGKPLIVRLPSAIEFSLRKEARRHHVSEAEYIRHVLRKHLKEELQAHLARINDIGNSINDIAYSGLDSHVKQYILGCRRLTLDKLDRNKRR